MAMSISLTVMTFNLHRDDPSDDLHSWQKRKHACIDIVAKYTPMILCTQEGLKSQLEDLEQALPGYDHFGLSRKGSYDSADEHCTIFFNKELVEKMEGGTFWLSESPSVPASTSWGSTAPSIATWATFQIKGLEPPGFTFQVVNTHLDESNTKARKRGALLTWQHIASLPSNLPVIYCGGFGTIKDSSVGRFLLGRSREHRVLGNMADAFANSRRRKTATFIRTYHGFKGQNQGTAENLNLLLRALCLCWDRHSEDLHVDWVLFRGQSLSPLYSEVVNDCPNGNYPSDHYPVYVEFTLPRSVRPADEPLLL